MSEERANATRKVTWTGQRPKLAAIWRAVVEIGFIIFLFYSNLLMGEFTHSRAGQGPTLAAAIEDLMTIRIFEIGLVCALIG